MFGPALFLGFFLLSACVTPSRAYDSEHPGDAWDATCSWKEVERLPAWIIVNCEFTNRSEQDLVFPSNLDLQVQDEIWRKPKPEELEQLKHDLRTLQKTQAAAPIFTSGGQRLDMFLAQVVITSGLWIAQNFKSDPTDALSPPSPAKVPPAKTLERVFALYKVKAGHPDALSFRDPDGLFEKAAPVTSDSGAVRRRESSEPEKPK